MVAPVKKESSNKLLSLFSSKDKDKEQGDLVNVVILTYGYICAYAQPKYIVIISH